MEDIIREELKRLGELRISLPRQLDGVMNQIYILEHILERESKKKEEEGTKCDPV